MYLYYFHIRVGQDRIEDDEGLWLCDLDSAREEMRLSAHELARAIVAHGRPLDGQAIEICDENGRLLDVMPLVRGLD